jgi:hypothetical protein
MDTETTTGALAGQKVKGLDVQVTAQHIATAVPKNSGHCMVSDAVKAAAVRRKLRIGKVLTDLQTVRFSDLDKKVRYICFTPRVAQVALLDFDQGKWPTPFKFRLAPVQIIAQQHRAKPKPRARLATRPTNSGGYTRPIKHGGEALATTVGLRREFGLRQMGVVATPVDIPAES